MIAHRERRRSLIGDRVRDLFAIGQGLRGLAFIHDDFSAHRPGDAADHGRVELHVRAVGNIELPTHPYQRVAGLEQQRIAQIGRNGRRRRSRRCRWHEVEHSQHPLASAIGDFKQRGAVALRGILGLQHIQIGGKLDQSLRVARSAVQVDDDLVVRELGIDGKIDLADDLFIVHHGEIMALGDLDAGNAGIGQRGDEQQSDAAWHADYSTSKQASARRSIMIKP